ncbi:MAG: DUF4411 family protein [Alphaproteobacteria bacterium]|nr:DUF4411 family protein [Alphaproteobacteria bacterium]
MLYLLDANTLIRANADYYGLNQVPPFWSWLVAEAAAGHVKMPFEIHAEIAAGNDDLADWITRRTVVDALVLDEEVDSGLFNYVLATAYGPNLTDTELEEAGADPFLVTYALMGDARTVVTKEISRPSKTRGRRKLPDACDDVNVPWMNDFRFYKARGFRIP